MAQPEHKSKYDTDYSALQPRVYLCLVVLITVVKSAYDCNHKSHNVGAGEHEHLIAVHLDGLAHWKKKRKKVWYYKRDHYSKKNVTFLWPFIEYNKSNAGERSKGDTNDTNEVERQEFDHEIIAHCEVKMVNNTAPHVKSTSQSKESHETCALPLLQFGVDAEGTDCSNGMPGEIKGGQEMREDVHRLVV